MNRKFTPQLALIAMLLFSFQVSTLTAQVGINTTAPAGGSMLDVDSANKGMLIPRLDIANLSTIAPVTGGSTTSLLAYNTNTTTGPGYVYWNGSIWVGIDGERDWKLAGNDNTNPGTTDGDDFIGTRDSNELILATDQTEALRITTSQRLLAGNDGNSSNPEYSFGSDTDVGMYRSAANTLSFSTLGAERFSIEANGRLRSHVNGNLAEPAYTFETDPDTGIWRSTGNADDNLNISAGGREMVEFNENGNSSEVVFNDTSEQTDFRVESNNDANMLFIDGSSNEIGIKTNDPQAELHIAGATSAVRVDALNSANSTFNNGIDNSVVYADTDGNLVLQARVDDFPVDSSDSTTFFAAPVTVTDASGVLLQGTVHTETITLTRETLIEVCFWTSVDVRAFGGGLVTDGKPRIFGAYVTDGATDIVYNASSYTNAILSNDGYFSTGDVTTGFFTVGGNGFINLPIGTHTISMVIFAGGGEAVLLDETNSPRAPDGYQITFGANAFNRFQIVYHN